MATDPIPTSPETVPAEIPSTPDDRTMALVAHLTGILTWFVGPLIVWLIKKDQSKYVDDQAKEALNFQLTLLIGDVISIATTFFCVGFILWAVVYVARIVFGIMAAVAANRGEVYRYPFCIRLIK